MRAAITVFIFLYTLLPSTVSAQTPEAVDPKIIVREAINYWRDRSSISESAMQVHRPDWQRKMSFKAWTKGSEQSLVRFTAPARDSGNATLKDGKRMWSFSPKVNRIIRIPPSMMTQSWMGSDFSYNDFAKADEIVHDYTHSLLGEAEVDGIKTYTVEAIPLENAPVVWGKEILHIRADYIIVLHEFYDQDTTLVKRMKTKKIAPIGGKLYPVVMRMEQIEEPEKWTEVSTVAAQFGVELSDGLFTLSHLRNPR